MSMNNSFHLVKTTTQEKEKRLKYSSCKQYPFHSFTLLFYEERINIEYNKENIQMYLSIIAIAISFIYSLVTFVLIIIPSQKEIYEIVSTFSFGINVFFVLIYILLYIKTSMFKCKDKKFIEMIVLYEQYIMISLTNCLLRQYLMKQYINYDYSHISMGFLIADLLIKYLWIISSLNEFIMVFCGNILSLIIIISFYTTTTTTTTNHNANSNTEVNLFIITTTVMLIFHTIISFYFTRAGKIIYFLKTLSQSGFELLDIINTGYVSLSYDGSINYFNSFFNNDSFNNTFNLLQASKEDFIYDLINGHFDSINEEIWNNIHNVFSTTSNSQLSNKTGNTLMNYINDCKSASTLNKENRTHNLRKERDDNNNESQQVIDFYTQMPKESLIKIIIKYLLGNENKCNGFIYLGQKKIVNEKERKVVLLDVLFRHNTFSHSIEFIFNDESKLNYQFLYNTFVQQISEYLHDFKNPLITLNEELSEIQDTFINLQNHNKTEFKFDDCFIAKIDFLTSTTSDCTDMIKSFASYAKNILVNSEEIEIKMASFDLIDLLTYIRYWMNIKIFRSKKKIEFNVESQLEDSLQFYSDRMKLKQVLINILSNSFKFTHNGHIILKVTREICNMKQYIKFEVEDSGVGMDDNIKKSIFKPFASYNPDNMNKEGCGLGLVISKKITDKLGIGLDIESYPKKGTKMWFYCEEKDIYQTHMNSNATNTNTKHQRIITCNKNEDIIEFKGLTALANIHPNPKNDNNTINKNNHTNIISNNSRSNTSPQNNSNETNSPSHHYRRKSFTSKLNVIKEESSLKNENNSNNNNNNNNDTLSCEEPMQISPFEKCEYFSSSSPKRRKNKFSLDIVCTPMLHDNLFDDNNDINPIKTVWSRINNNTHPNYFIDLSICHINSITYLSVITQKEKTINMLLRSGTMNKKEPIYLGRQQRDNSDNNIMPSITQATTNTARSILIVDDDESIRKSIKRLITDMVKTMVIEEASDGLDVLQLFLKRKTIGFEWIIIDNTMTYLNGTELISVLEFLLQSSFCDKCKFDATILKRIVISTGNEDGAKYQLAQNKDIKIQPKPIEKAFLKDLLDIMV